MKPTKKYVLKPGKHQFAPGSAAIHANDNLSDKEAEWYINKYPHIKKLFIISQEEPQENEPLELLSIKTPVKLKPKSVKSK